MPGVKVHKIASPCCPESSASKPPSTPTHFLWSYPRENHRFWPPEDFLAQLQRQTRLMSSNPPLDTFLWPLNHLHNKFAGHCLTLIFKSKKMSWQASLGHAEHFILLTSVRQEWWPFSRLTTQGEVTAENLSHAFIQSRALRKASTWRNMNLCRPRRSKAAFLF